MAASGDIIRATAVMSQGTVVTVENVYHFIVGNVLGTPDTTLMNDLAGFIDTAMIPVAAHMGAGTTFIDIQFHNRTTNLPLGAVAWPTLTAGSASDQALPPQDSALSVFYTGLLKVIGKKYLGALTELSNDGGVIASLVVVDLITYAAALLGILIGSGIGDTYQCGVVDKTGHFRPFTGARVSHTYATQRRRRQGVGI